MRIRDAHASDIGQITALHIANQRETYRGLLSREYLDHLNPEDGERKWREYMLVGGRKLFVACEEDRFLGFAACREDTETKGCMYLDSLHVSPEARGRGVGTALIRAAGKAALENGYDAMSVCIVRGNESARRLYVGLGASHVRFFIDHFEGTESRSEKLRWEDLRGLQTDRRGG